MNQSKTEINYCDYKHSYCHALEPKLRMLWCKTFVEKKPVNYLVKTVTNILNQAEDKVKWTEKEKQFVADIQNCETAEQVYWRCYNAVNYTKKNVFATVDENGTLVK